MTYPDYPEAEIRRFSEWREERVIAGLSAEVDDFFEHLVTERRLAALREILDIVDERDGPAYGQIYAIARKALGDDA